MTNARLSPLDGHSGRLSDAVSRPGPARAPTPCQACSIRHLTVCAALADDELRHLSDIVAHIELGPGQSLFQESDEARSVYSVTAGTIKVYKLLPDGRCQVTGFLFPGDFLGLAHDETYAYSAEAVTHSALCSYPRSKLESLLKRFPQMEQRLLGMATHELVVAQEQMLLLGRKTAKERLASFLLMLSRAAARRGQSGNPVLVPMSRSDIGDYLGLTTETVSRSFTQLKRDRVIAAESGNRIRLLDDETLHDLAEGV